nr:PREDICTED: metalloproteinase inhibitor 2 [Odobenus rosmarus divergens]
MPAAKGDGSGTGERSAAGVGAGAGRARPAPLGFAGTESKVGQRRAPAGGLRDGTPSASGGGGMNEASVGRGSAHPGSRWNGVHKGSGPGDAAVAPARLPGGSVCAVRSQAAQMWRPLQASDFTGLPAHPGTASLPPSLPLSGVTLDWIRATQARRADGVGTLPGPCRLCAGQRAGGAQGAQLRAPRRVCGSGHNKAQFGGGRGGAGGARGGGGRELPELHWPPATGGRSRHASERNKRPARPAPAAHASIEGSGSRRRPVARAPSLARLAAPTRLLAAAPRAPSPARDKDPTKFARASAGQGLLLLGTLLRPADACSCSPVHPQQAFCNADVVIRAKAVSVKEVDSGNDIYGNPIKRIQYEIKQIKMFKGPDKDIEFIYTAPSSAVCGVSLDIGGKKEYLIAGKAEGNGKMHITLCDFIVPWDTLSTTQKKSLNHRYQMGCECKITRCPMIPCYISSPDECLWMDWVTEKNINGHQAKFFACIKRSDGSCAWYRGAAPPKQEFLDIEDP